MEIRRIAIPPRSLLLQISSVPQALYVRGDASLLESFSIAIVGTRNASGYGLATALRFGRELSDKGAVVVSGLARGIDTAAHRGALIGKGKTVAVLGHGLDRIYPSQNAELAREILEQGGCLVSEYEPGVPPLKQNFPARNRIIAGLCRGVVVVEAAQRSGSLITARFAADFGREVFVPPGRIEGSGFRGSHCLIREGARLVCSIDEILEEFAFAHVLPREISEVAQESSAQRGMWQLCFNGEVRTLEELFHSWNPEGGELLTQLEIALKQGWITDLGAQRYALVCSTDY